MSAADKSTTPRKFGPLGTSAEPVIFIITAGRMVGPNGLEPLTSTVSRWRSSQLSYGPTDLPNILAQGLSAFARYLFIRRSGLVGLVLHYLSALHDELHVFECPDIGDRITIYRD